MILAREKPGLTLGRHWKKQQFQYRWKLETGISSHALRELAEDCLSQATKRAIMQRQIIGFIFKEEVFISYAIIALINSEIIKMDFPHHFTN